MLPRQQKEAHGFFPGEDSGWSWELQHKVQDKAGRSTLQQDVSGEPHSVCYSAAHVVCQQAISQTLTSPTTASSTLSVGSYRLTRQKSNRYSCDYTAAHV